MQQRLNYWLALINAPGLRSKVFFNLLKAPIDITEIFANPLSFAKQYGLNKNLVNYLQKPDWQGVATYLKWADEPNNHLLTWDDELYPPLLREIADPPLVLFAQGDKSYLIKPQLAIVGSRNPTPNGVTTAYKFAHALAQRGLVITSGLALGIDTASHQGALAANRPTIAVMGTGIDNIYPKRHIKLAKIIANNGLLLTEFPLATPAKAMNFPQRNRIISGLALGTLVVEASLQSGSLITARLAVEQGREVFAIPGSIHNPLSRGCHMLLRQGAKLVEQVQDIIEEFLPLLPRVKATNITKITLPTIDNLAEHHYKLLECIGFEATSVDDCIERSGLSAQKIMPMLTALELRGEILLTNYGYIRIKK